MTAGNSFGDAVHHPSHDGNAIWLSDILVDGKLKLGEWDDVEFDAFLIDVKFLDDVFEFVEDSVTSVWRGSEMNALNLDAAS